MDGTSAIESDGRPTIGVLSTWFGGVYFGRLLAGLAPVVAAQGGRIVGLQTLDAGTVSVDLGTPPDYPHPVAWDHISAFVVVLNAVNGEYLRAARRAGKPVVAISDTVPGFDCPTVLPDNRSGMREAVAHLIEHGHQRIGFVGNPVQRDLLERYQTYRQTLLDHGIEPDPELFFDTGDNQVLGGERAALALMAAKRPPTAVVTGNDLNALGLARTLRPHGYRLPQDLAIIGFDDMDDAAFHRPSLSTVRQPFEAVGAAAGTLLLQALRGEETPPGFHYIPTSFVARESCGCPNTLRLSELERNLSPIRSERELTEGVTRALEFGVGNPIDAGLVAAAVESVTASLHAAARDRPGPEFVDVQHALTELYVRRPYPESLVAVMRCIRRYGAHVIESMATDGPAWRRVDACVQELILTLSNIQATGQFDDISESRSTFFTHHQVSIDLLRGHEEDLRSLRWLARQPIAKGGCVGLWPADQTGRRRPRELELFGSFPRALGGDPPPRTPLTAFPPAELIALVDDLPDHMVFVVPMKVRASDRGMLAVVAPIEPRLSTGRENVSQWAAMFTIALDHMAILDSQREQQELLRHIALYDELTELPNRRYFLDRLGQALRQTRAHGDLPFAVLLLDLDGFKITNDSLGHLAGDRLLVQVAARITESIRDVDLVARVGGDEFLILLDGVGTSDEATAAAERLQAALATPFRLGEQEVVVGASIGIALSAGSYERAEDLVRNADIAMYQAKARGRATHAVFNVGMHARAVGRLRTEASLRQALERDEFAVYYQPIVDLGSGRISAFETLIRWRHPTRGLLSPAAFLPIAEESGLIVPIGRWLLDTACEQLHRWHTAYGARDLRISVNVSNRQFWHSALLDDLTNALRTADIPASGLDVEVTEGVIMHDVKLARSRLSEVHGLGVGIHIDDFGTGYSSLEALHRLSIDALKIDRSFVTPLAVDSRSRELVRSIITMAANLGLDVVAEGIETDDQREHLVRLGCHFGQGYWFSRPTPVEGADALLAGQATPVTRAIDAA